MTKPSKTLLQASYKNGLILALFALISTGLIAIIHSFTKEKIAAEIEAAMARRLNEIIRKTEYDNDVYQDCKRVYNPELLGSRNEQKLYRMRKQNEDYAVFLSSIAPDGYGGKIKLVIGIYTSGEIAGVRVTEHQETPGLGDKIEVEKSDWIKQFNGKSLKNLEEKAWRVKKDGGQFDALTGATITPRAIVKAVYKSLQFYEHDKAKLFNADNLCGADK